MSYPTTFRTYIQRTVDYALNEVKQSPPILPDNVRINALHALDYGLDYAECWKETSDLLLTLAPKMELAGVRDTQWIESLSDGLKSSRERQEDRTTSSLALNLGMLYRFQSDFPQAIGALEEAVEKAKEIGDRVLAAQALNELAWVEQLQHRHEEATAHANEALALSDKNSIEHGMSLRVLGMIAFQKIELKKAEELHRASLTNFQQNGDDRRSAWALQNLALVLRRQERFDEALLKSQQAADILHQVNDLHHWTIAKTNLGVVYSQLEMYETALSHLLEAEKWISQSQNMLQWANVSNSLGLVYFRLNRLENAKQAFQNAISLFNKLGDDEWRINNLDGLGMVYLAQKQFSQAQSIIESALAELHKIEGTASYNYLIKVLNEHLQEAKKGQDSGEN